MDEEYSEGVDTSADMDVSDTDIAEDIPADIPDDVPEDIPEDDSSDSDVADDFSENVSDDAVTDEAEYDDVDDSIEEDSIELEAEEMDESIDDFEEDSNDDSEIPQEDDVETDDIPEDSGEIEEAAESEVTDVEDIPEDTGSDVETVQDEFSEDEIPEDVTDTETADETADADVDVDAAETDTAEQSEDVTDVDGSDTTEQPEDVADTEATNETDDAEDTDTAEQSEDVTDAVAMYETADAEDTAAAEQPEDVTDTKATNETDDAENTDATDQPEDMTDTEATDETADADAAETTDETTDTEDTDDTEQTEDMTDAETTDETAYADDADTAEQPRDVTDTETADESAEADDTDAAEQPENMTDTEATDENADVEDTNVTDTEATNEAADVGGTDTTERSENQSDLETYDYETSPETQDAVNPETSGEFVSAENPYRERWEKFGEEFSGNSEADRWDSLKDVPFSGEDQADTGTGTEGTDAEGSAMPSETADVDNSSEASEINSISDYMNTHNYGPDDFATYSQDPQWRQLMRQEYPDYELPEMTQESAHAQLSQYMNDHNYGVDDYAEYSQDPVWRELHSTAFPNDELPPLSDATGGQNMDSTVSTSADSIDLNSPGSGNNSGKPTPKNPDDIDEGQLFGSFETDKHINGSDSFVMGDNYERFKRDYYSPEESSYEAYDVPKEVDISPNMIEGIHLGERELEDPSVFWSQHEKNGTLESFKEIASHIPDVRKQLASGKTMDELLADPELSECTGIYFANKPKVIENDGYYEFDSNGRHRILAAREAGYDIPVEVIGRRNRSEVIKTQDPETMDGELYANIGGDLSKQVAADNKEFGSIADKVRNFFTPSSKDNDLIEPVADNAIEPNQDVQSKPKWTPPAIKGVDIKESKADITPLNTTRQSINLVDLPDGSKARVFDHPSDLKKVLPFSQGKNEYSKSGTCALADTGVWLRVAGSRYAENDVVGFASTHTDRKGQPLCSKSGGTLPSNIPDIWEHFGMPAYSDSSKNLESIAEAVESGKAVSVGVNAGTLWEQDNAEEIKIPQDCYGDGGANHAIGIMSCERDPIYGNVTHFYINDTGRTYERDACRRISVEDFWKAFNVKRACATISQKPVW